jgi:predicted flap endonuclease-1-like 5' DNA nuclease
MGFFFSKTWYWWLLATLVAVLITLLICWLRNRGLDEDAAANERELAQARLLVGAHEQRIDTLLAQRAKDIDEIASLKGAATAGAAAGAATATVAGLSAEQLANGAGVLGFKLQADDLKVVEGIGPAIESLLHGAGITTWRALQQTDPARIREVLDAAGPRFKMHDPGTWPRQAGLLADGQWDEFKKLTDELLGGR